MGRRRGGKWYRPRHAVDYLLVFVPLALLLELLRAAPTLVFAVSALGIVPLAGLMGRSTEQLSERAGPGIGGLLNATFGNAAELIIALIGLSRGLNLEVVAEGAELLAEVEFLKDNGCDIIQGFFFSKPVEAVEFEKKLTRRAA